MDKAHKIKIAKHVKMVILFIAGLELLRELFYFIPSLSGTGWRVVVMITGEILVMGVMYWSGFLLLMGLQGLIDWKNAIKARKF